MADVLSLSSIVVGGLGTVLGSGLGGLGAYLATRAKLKQSPPAEMVQAAATFQTAVNAGAADLVGGLERRIDGLTSDLGATRDELTETRQELREARREIVQLQDENEHCRAEGRQLQQRINSLQSRLRGLGIDIPRDELAGSLLMIEDGKASLLKPIDQPRAARPARRRRKPKGAVK